MKLIILSIITLTLVTVSNAQTSILKVNPNIKLTKDSIVNHQLVSSLDKFLISAQSNAKQNEWVYKPEFLHTTPLLDEIEGIDEQLIEEDSVYYKPYLFDVNTIEKNQYIIQIAYLSSVNNSPLLRANIELIARKTGNKFLFSSPLIRKTKNWKSTTIETITFYYQNTADMQKIEDYHRLRSFYDNKLNVTHKEAIFYLVEENQTSQNYFGLPYKSDYNGRGNNISWSVLNETQEIYILNASNFYEFDPHDLWHNRLRQLVSRRDVNHAVDEGIATLYGGSWGISWKEMFNEFEKQIKFNKGTDWLDLKAKKTALYN